MNFLKNSIFTRRTGEDEAELEPENDNQVLAVWGSPGSGKSTVAVKLAKHLADHKRDVALVLCDMTAPMLPCVCPPADLDGEHSLGSVLAAPRISQTLVSHNCITHKKQSHLTILGLRKGENEYTYPPYTAGQVSVPTGDRPLYHHRLRQLYCKRCPLGCFADGGRRGAAAGKL